MTAAQTWASKIRCVLAKTVEAIVETGLLLEAAKADLGHGKFLQMLHEDVHVSPDVAQEYMRIARDPIVSNTANSRLLPASRSALNAVTRLDDRLKVAALADGRIHPGLTAEDVRRLGTSTSSPAAWDRIEAQSALRATLNRVLEGAPLKDVEPMLADLAVLIETTRRAYAGPHGPEDLVPLLALRDELADAEPGQRILILDEVGKVTGALREPSTYPRWMGPRRTRTEADRQIRAIDQLLDGRAAGLLGAELLTRARGTGERKGSRW